MSGWILASGYIADQKVHIPIEAQARGFQTIHPLIGLKLGQRLFISGGMIDEENTNETSCVEYLGRIKFVSPTGLSFSCPLRKKRYSGFRIWHPESVFSVDSDHASITTWTLDTGISVSQSQGGKIFSVNAQHPKLGAKLTIVSYSTEFTQKFLDWIGVVSEKAEPFVIVNTSKKAIWARADGSSIKAVRTIRSGQMEPERIDVGLLIESELHSS